MDKKTFLERLEYLIQDFSEEEREDAIAYYRDYLEEAGAEQEEAVLRDFGSPERIAAIIRAEQNGNLQEQGIFTETGYKEDVYREPGYEVELRERAVDGNGNSGEDTTGRYAGGSQRNARTGRNILSKGAPLATALKVVLLIALVVTAFPFAIGIGGGILGILAAVIGVLAALFLLAGILLVGFWGAALILFIVGIGTLMSQPWSGLMGIGGALILTGLGFFALVLCILIYGKFLPWLFRSITEGLNRLVHRKRAV